jgi:pimeloyl-[acyl-carrier protein] methyl ester esterase
MSDVVFWHGWGMQPSVWNNVIALLDKMREGESLLRAQPLPGYDGTAAPEPYTAEALVDAMLAELPGPVALCGWSLGAMLALLAAQRHPDKVKRLILIGATPSFVRREGWPCAMETGMLAEFAAAVALDPQTARRRFIALFNQNDSNARHIGRALAPAETPSAAVLDSGLALLGEIDLRGIIQTIVQPTLLIHGEHDPLMPLAAAQWLAETMPHARLEVLSNAAHAPFISDPARCAALISEFLDE